MAARRLHRSADTRQPDEHNDAGRDRRVGTARNKAVMRSLQVSSPFGGVYTTGIAGVLPQQKGT